MASLNRIFLIGNLTRDPELRYIPSGQAVATLRMAVTERYRTKAGENREETLFIDVIVWGKSGENCAQYLKKGSPAFVEGRLRIREFEGRDGTKQRRTEVTAMRVQFLSRGVRAGGGGGEEAPPVDAGGGAPGGGEQVEEPLPPLDEDGG
jgi:single-strand DNA-binding protein